MEEIQTRELQEELSRLRSLREHPGYDYLMAIAQAQIETRRQEFELKPLDKHDDIYKQEYSKGEIAGIMLFKEMANARILHLETDLLTDSLDELTEGTQNEPTFNVVEPQDGVNSGDRRDDRDDLWHNLYNAERWK